MVLDLPRYFDPLGRVFGWAVSNRDNGDFNFTVLGIRRDNDRARAVLPAFVMPLVGLMGPEKRKRNDKAGSGRGNATWDQSSSSIRASRCSWPAGYSAVAI